MAFAKISQGHTQEEGGGGCQTVAPPCQIEILKTYLDCDHTVAVFGVWFSGSDVMKLQAADAAVHGVTLHTVDLGVNVRILNTL